jgi:hypothetical protein
MSRTTGGRLRFDVSVRAVPVGNTVTKPPPAWLVAVRLTATAAASAGIVIDAGPQLSAPVTVTSTVAPFATLPTGAQYPRRVS